MTSFCCSSIFSVFILCKSVSSLHNGPFYSEQWQKIEQFPNYGSPHLTEFYVALKIKREEQLTQEFHELSDPNSPTYGKYYSLKDLSERFGPKIDDQEMVMSFFSEMKDASISINANRDIIHIKAPVHSVESLLQTEIKLHRHISLENSYVLRATKPLTIPSNIKNLISFITLNTPVLKSKLEKKVNDINHQKNNVSLKYMHT